MKPAEKQPWALQVDAGQGSVKLSGELDYSSSTKLRAALEDFIKLSKGPVDIDLTGLEYLDSSGLAVLIELRKKLKVKNRELTVAGVHPNAEKVIRLTQVAELFGI